MEEHSSVGNGWICYGAHLQAKIGLWGMGEGHERWVLMLLCLSCTILTAVIISQHIVNISAKDNTTSKSQSMAIASLSHLSNKDIGKMVANAEQFAAVHACGEANSLLSKFSTKKKVLNFILLPTRHQNDTQEDEQGNNNACMKTQQSNPMHEC